MSLAEETLAYLNSIAPDAQGVMIDPADLIFEEAVKMNCFYCGKYGNNWRCPPKLPQIDFQQMMKEFDQGMFVIYSFNIKERASYNAIRSESSIVLHKTLLKLEKFMWDHNASTAISFIGGSCKLCKDGCGKERCNNPYMSRSPLEATGVNVVKSAKKYGINITFPTDNKLIRCGLLLWQEEDAT